MSGGGNDEWRSFSDRERPENFAKIGPHKIPEARVKQNNIAELTNMLFDQLGRLEREENAERLQQEIMRGRAMSDIAAQILKSGDLMLRAASMRGAARKMPKLLE
jgi:hypothetical protein